MKKSRKSGQTIVEYVILIAIIAVAAIAVIGVFSDRIRTMFGGATVELGGDQAAVDSATDQKSQDWLKNLQKDGATGSGN